jgi:hypothetical protein
MGLARYVVEAVVLEGRSYREVSRAHGVSKSWVAKVVGRFREGGYEAIAPRRQGSAGAGVKDQPELRQGSGDAGVTSITRNTTSRGAPGPNRTKGATSARPLGAGRSDISHWGPTAIPFSTPEAIISLVVVSVGVFIGAALLG